MILDVFVLSFFPRGVLDEILNLIESVSEGFPSYSSSAGASYNSILMIVAHGPIALAVGAGGRLFGHFYSLLSFLSSFSLSLGDGPI